MRPRTSVALACISARSSSICRWAIYRRLGPPKSWPPAPRQSCGQSYRKSLYSCERRRHRGRCCRRASPHGKLILAVLGALAEFERSMILARTADGRARAQARGVKFGRKRVLTPFQVQEALARRTNGEALTDIGRSYGVSHPTISRL